MKQCDIRDIMKTNLSCNFKVRMLKIFLISLERNGFVMMYIIMV